MNYRQGEYPIIEKVNLAKNCYSFLIYCPHIAAIAAAGQFAHVRAEGFFLRRPISICEIDQKRSALRLVFEVRGEGTNALARLNEGDLIDLLAPLGRGFSLPELPSGKKALFIGGGIGTPPLLEGVKHYAGAGMEKPEAILGFRSAPAVILREDFQKAGASVTLCTDDGTMGRKGFVSEAAGELLDTGSIGYVAACGPHAMLKSIVKLCEEHSVFCEVSLEERMGCGVGACLVCACKTVKDGESYVSHVCKDGPVFDAKEVLL